jgi:hypothetical protein
MKNSDMLTPYIPRLKNTIISLLLGPCTILKKSTPAMNMEKALQRY